MTQDLEGGHGLVGRRTVLKTAGATVGVSALLSLSGVGAANGGTEVDLMAGQHSKAGIVTVSLDTESLTVTYDTSGTDWKLLGTHLHVAQSEEDVPQNRKGNPKVGKFEYSGKPDPAPDDVAEYHVDISELSGEIVIAAHAEVVEYFEAAPYFAAGSGYTATQGDKKSGGAISEARSDPQDALVKAYPDGEFFSLGFMPDGEGGFEEEGGSIEITLDCPLVNGDGDDFRIWEVTFGTYPDETADVSAWYDGQWVYVGEANNENSGPAGDDAAHTVSTFDLGAVEDPDYETVESTTKLKIVDTTNASPHNGNADAFDLDGIEILQDCTGDEETAWGAGTGFVERGSWATYFTYDLGE